MDSLKTSSHYQVIFGRWVLNQEARASVGLHYYNPFPVTTSMLSHYASHIPLYKVSQIFPVQHLMECCLRGEGCGDVQAVSVLSAVCPQYKTSSQHAHHSHG